MILGRWERNSLELLQLSEERIRLYLLETTKQGSELIIKQGK